MITATRSLLLAFGIAAGGEGPFHALTYDQALEKAQADKKIVFIDFYTTWCGPCKKLDAVTWKDADVQKWFAEKTVALKIDAEKETKLAERFKLTAYPTLILIRPEGKDGKEFERLVGYRDAKTFLAEMKDALEGKTSLVRSKEELDRAKQDADGKPQDLTLRQRYAEELARAGQDADALREYLVCFDEGRGGAGYGGVRLSFLLGSIVQLGRSYPPAIEALATRRDAAEARLVAGSKSHDDLAEFAAINENLKDDPRTLALFDQLKTAGPIAEELRWVFLDKIPPQLAEAKRYADLLELVPDPDKHLDAAIKRFEFIRNTSQGDEETRQAMESAHGMLRARVVGQAAIVYEALLATKDVERAGKLADRVIEFAPKGGTYATLVKAAGRAGAEDQVTALVTRATAALDEKELKAVTRAASKVAVAK